MATIPVRMLAGQGTYAGIKVRALQEVLGVDGLRHELHRHDHYFFLIVQRGSGQHEIDLVPYPLMSRQVYVVRPGQVHQLFIKPSAQGFILSVASSVLRHKDAVIRQIIRRSCRQSVYTLPSPTFTQVAAILEAMRSEVEHRAFGFEALLPMHLLHVLVVLSRQRQEDASVPSARHVPMIDVVDELYGLIDEHVAERLSASAYAEMLQRTPRQLDALTRAAVGRSVAQILDDAVMMESKRRLVSTLASVKTIAYDLGFEDPSYFVRFFKRHEGETPLQFRLRHHAQGR